MPTNCCRGMETALLRFLAHCNANQQAPRTTQTNTPGCTRTGVHQPYSAGPLSHVSQPQSSPRCARRPPHAPLYPGRSFPPRTSPISLHSMGAHDSCLISSTKRKSLSHGTAMILRYCLGQSISVSFAGFRGEEMLRMDEGAFGSRDVSNNFVEMH